MSEWYDNQKNKNSNFRQLLKERIEKANPRRNLNSDETRRLAKLEAIADKLKRGENLQNRQLQTWLSDDEYAHIEAEANYLQLQSSRRLQQQRQALDC